MLDGLRPEQSSLSSRDKILSYASTSFGSLCLRSSYALFQSCSDRVEGENRTSEGACSVKFPAGAGETVGGGGTEEGEAIVGEWIADSGLAGG